MLLAAAAVALLAAGGAHAAAPSPTCPEGTDTTYNPQTGLCEVPAEPDCSDGFGYVPETGKCETYATPECFNGSVEDGKCVYLSRCSSGSTYDAASGTCKTPQGVTYPPMCEHGGEQVGDSAYCAREPDPPCREGQTPVRYDGYTRCQYEPVYDCPDGTSLDQARLVCTVAAVPPPLPTSKDECKDEGWKAYGTRFVDQGDCVSFVASGGKNPPAAG